MNVMQHASTKNSHYAFPMNPIRGEFEVSVLNRAKSYIHAQQRQRQTQMRDDKDYKPSLSLQVKSKRQEEAEVENKLETD